MAFPKKLLNDNEQVVLDLRPHWMFFFEPILSGVVAVGVFLLAAILFSGGTFNDVLNFLVFVTIVASLGWAGWRFMNWFTTYFVVTSDRLIYRSGVLRKQGIQIPLERVNNVLFSQNIWERIVNAGDLIIESAGESGRQEFEDVKHPDSVQNLIYKVMEDNENRKFDRMGQSAREGLQPTAPAAPLNIGEELERLEGLLQRGTLTQAEFDRQKAKLLGGLPPP